MKRILISLLVLSMAGQVDCQAQFVKKLSEAWKKVKTTVNTLSESQKSKTTTATPSTTTGTSSGTKTTAATPTKVAGLDIKMPQVVKVVKVTSATLNIRKSASATKAAASTVSYAVVPDVKATRVLPYSTSPSKTTLCVSSALKEFPK